jgi:tetratricopeptide (TPR) repeat protein
MKENMIIMEPHGVIRIIMGMKTLTMMGTAVLLFVHCPAKDLIVIQEDHLDRADRISISEKMEGKNLPDSIRFCLKYNHLDRAGALIKRTLNDPLYMNLAPKLEGEVFLRTNQLDSARIHFERALELNRASGDTLLVRDINRCLFLTYFEMNDYARAAECLDRSGAKDRFFRDFLESFGDKKPYLVKAGSKRTTIPFEDLDPFPKIGVKVNGRYSRNFILDTGCSMTVLSRSLAEKCGVSPFVTVTPGIKKESQNYKIDVADRTFAILDSLQIGDDTLYNLPVLILDDSKMSFKILGITLYRLEGAVGLPVMKHFVMTVHYPKKEITFELPDQNGRTADERNLTLFQNQAFVHLAINHVSGFNFFIDSGTPLSTITKSATAFLDSRQVVFKKPREADIKHVDIQVKVLADMVPEKICLGGYQTAGFPLAVVERNFGNEPVIAEHGMIAQDFLRHFVVRYDFPNRVFELTRPGE